MKRVSKLKIKTLVVCYNCRRLVPKEEAFYIYFGMHIIVLNVIKNC